MGLTVVPGNMIEDGTVTDSNFTNTTITSTDMAVDPRNASNISSGSVPLAQLGNVPAIDYTGIDDDIALLGFKAAANGSLAKYNLLDQTVDAFEDATGIDAASSTNEDRDSSGKYVQGATTTRTTHTASGTYVTPVGLLGTVEVLVVAGGGAGSGGGNGGAGGGAGGLVYVNNYAAVASTTYNLTIGAGGAAQAAGTSGNDGVDSVFDSSGTTTTLTASGGGGGGEAAVGRNGGSGGGGWQTGNTAGGASDQVVSFSPYSNVGFGYAGGQGGNGAPHQGGGGGGAGAVGVAGKGSGGISSIPTGGNGGVGKAYTIADGSTSVYYAGGGGGGVTTGADTGQGGSGGGGRGGYGTSPTYFEPVAGTANTGGGGGGGRNDGGGAAGGSGVIITSHKTPNNMTLVSTATAAQAAPTKGDIVMTYTDGAGTAVINTNITAEISADGGSTWTAFTLASQGTTGGHTILTSHDQTITSTITAPYNMKYRIKTLVQSVALQTRIQAVSLGWS